MSMPPSLGLSQSSHAVHDPEPQKVFSATVAPGRLKNASPTVRPCTTPSLPRSS